MMLEGSLDFGPEDGGILVRTPDKIIPVEFDEESSDHQMSPFYMPTSQRSGGWDTKSDTV